MKEGRTFSINYYLYHCEYPTVQPDKQMNPNSYSSHSCTFNSCTFNSCTSKLTQWVGDHEAGIGTKEAKYEGQDIVKSGVEKAEGKENQET